MTIQTTITWQRILSDDEKAARDNKISELVTDGVTDGKIYTDIDGTLVDHTPSPSHPGGIRVWTTIDAANAWVEYVNTFVPPPESATVL